MLYIVHETKDAFDILGKATTLERARELRDWYKIKKPRLQYDIVIVKVIG